MAKIQHLKLMAEFAEALEASGWFFWLSMVRADNLLRDSHILLDELFRPSVFLKHSKRLGLKNVGVGWSGEVNACFGVK